MYSTTTVPDKRAQWKTKQCSLKLFIKGGLWAWSCFPQSVGQVAINFHLHHFNFFFSFNHCSGYIISHHCRFPQQNTPYKKTYSARRLANQIITTLCYISLSRSDQLHSQINKLLCYSFWVKRKYTIHIAVPLIHFYTK